jgi:predicted permease
MPLPQLEGISIRFDPSPDWRVFGFGFAIALLAGLVTGLLPAWQATRTDPVRVLTAGGVHSATISRRGRRLRTALVSAQVAMSVVLVLLAGLYVRSALAGSQVDIGYLPSGAAMASIDMRLHGIDDVRARAVLERLRTAAQGIPGVQRAALATGLPGGAGTVSQNTGPLALEGESLVDGRRGRVVRYLAVSPDFFQVLGLPLRMGRDFSDGDVESAAPVAIVSEGAAEAFWPGQDPLGRRFSLRRDDPVREVIGVVANTGSRLRGGLDLPFVYLPIQQEYSPRVSVIVRGVPDAGALLEPLRRGLRAVEPELAVFDVRTVEQTVGLALLPIRGAALVLGLLGLLAFGIAMLGVYGVLAYVVSQRTREFGIRKALGATSAGLYGLVIGAGFRMLILGAVPGMLLAFVAARLLGRLLYGIAPHDPITFTLIPAVLLMVGLCACVVAARRAARIDPTVALRDL